MDQYAGMWPAYNAFQLFLKCVSTLKNPEISDPLGKMWRSGDTGATFLPGKQLA